MRKCEGQEDVVWAENLNFLKINKYFFAYLDEALLTLLLLDDATLPPGCKLCKSTCSGLSKMVNA